MNPSILAEEFMRQPFSVGKSIKTINIEEITSKGARFKDEAEYQNDLPYKTTRSAIRKAKESVCMKLEN